MNIEPPQALRAAGARAPWIPMWMRQQWVARTFAVVALIAFPLVVPTDLISIGFVALQYALFALGLNIIVGWTGLLDLGAAGFVAVGAYATAILTTQFGWPPLLVLPAAAFTGALAGVVLGVPTLRHRADYFAILTLGFAELVALTIRNWPAVTRGSYGYSGIPAYRLLPFMEPFNAVPPIGFYYVAAAVLVASYFVVCWLRTTTIGRHFHLVKHSEVVGQTRGINILAVKLVAFGSSAALLATGGYFWAVYQRSIVWTEFGVLLSCMLLSLLIVGGIGNPRGVVLGAAVVGSALELLRRFLTATGLPQNARFLVFSSLLIVSVHLWPAGILPDRPAWLRRARRNPHPRDPGHQFEVVSVAGINSAPQSAALLEMDDLAKSFDGVVALDGVTLRMREGECLALVGTNGSGKTTLLNTISGLIRPQRGTIRFAGHRIDGLAPYRIARLGVGRSFQELSVFDDVDVADNVYIAATGASATDVRLALTRFRLQDDTTACSSLSYGQKKALDLARLFVRPRTLRLALLDEPTAGLSQHEAMEVVQALAELRAAYRLAMIVVSHDMMFLEALHADRVVVFHRGRVFAEGSFSEMRADVGVRKLFWGDEASI